MLQNQRITSLDIDNANEKELDFVQEEQIISLLSHDLRTPIAIISSNVQLLKGFAYELDNSMVRETFLLCEEAIGSMTGFIEDIYFLNILNKAGLKKNLSCFLVNDFFPGFIQKMKQRDFVNRDRIVYEEDFQPFEFCTDLSVLEKILKGLISNALKFSSEKVTIRVSSFSGDIVISIKDEGVGIPEDELDKVFNPFYRARNVKLIQGSGLGLSIVKKSIDLLGGRLEFTTQLKKGTKFKITIPNDECEKNTDH